MPIPIVVPIVLGALGGGSLLSWAQGSDDKWADADVFNTRMKDIHMGILQLNESFAKCEEIHTPENENVISAWRNFVQLWSSFYSSVGKVILTPNAQKIEEARSMAGTLNKWIKSYKDLCGGALPTGSMEIKLNDIPTGVPNQLPLDDDKPMSLSQKIGLGLVISAALYYAVKNAPARREELT